MISIHIFSLIKIEKRQYGAKNTIVEIMQSSSNEFTIIMLLTPINIFEEIIRIQENGNEKKYFRIS